MLKIPKGTGHRLFASEPHKGARWNRGAERKECIKSDATLLGCGDTIRSDRQGSMAHINKVIRSVNLDGETICVDIFLRPDGTYGFDEFRRDPEDGRGWYSIGHHGATEFATAEDALSAARDTVVWLNDTLPG